MILEELKDKQSAESSINDIKKLETENLLKNAYVLEIQQKLEGCYDKENKIDPDKLLGFVKFLDKDLYGVNQSISELYDITCSVNNVCDYLKTLKLKIMETQKAIKLIQNYLKGYSLWSNLYGIGLDPGNYSMSYTELGIILFDFDEEAKYIDEVGDVFFKNADKMISKHTGFVNKLEEDLLTNTAIDNYSDWKALKHQIKIKA